LAPRAADDFLLLPDFDLVAEAERFELDLPVLYVLLLLPEFELLLETELLLRFELDEVTEEVRFDALRLATELLRFV
jgi:hypothetical protein